MTKDKQGRPYTRQSELKAGDTVTVDGDFKCLKPRSDAAKLEGDGAAYATTVRGEAEASAIRARAAALAANINLVLLTQAEKWNGVLPHTMLPGATVPFISVK